jgi:hypothetical protein
MSTAGIFILLSNDGKQDRMITATNLLSKRLKQYREMRVQRGELDPEPSLSDIEKTHVLFMNAHYKPYVALAYEYNKVSASNVTLGTEVQMSIPQFGDFFHDMVVHVKIAAPTTGFTGTAVNDSDAVLYKWCDYPGERLFKSVSFEVNGNPLDSYKSTAVVMHRQFHVPTHKLSGWKRNMGQEEAKEAYYQYDEATVGTAAPLAARACVSIKDGFQTYKASHGDLELFIPLQFWFNKDPRLAVPSAAIPYGQRFLKFELESASNLLRAILNPAATTALTLPTVSTPTISTFDLYINNIFVNPDIHDIYIKRIGFNLIRVHRRQQIQVTRSSDSVLLNSLMWPIESLYVGIQPTANTTTNADLTSTGDQTSVIDPNMEDWHRFGQITNTDSLAATVNGVGTDYTLKTEANHITKLGLTLHSIPVYNDIPSQFFNSYTTLQYGGCSINTPTDPGLFFVPFALYPGSYQPSGHVNASRAREFYLNYTSTYITSVNTATLVAEAIALNFLLISDGSAVLRFNT